MENTSPKPCLQSSLGLTQQPCVSSPFFNPSLQWGRASSFFSSVPRTHLPLWPVQAELDPWLWSLPPGSPWITQGGMSPGLVAQTGWIWALSRGEEQEVLPASPYGKPRGRGRQRLGGITLYTHRLFKLCRCYTAQWLHTATESDGDHLNLNQQLPCTCMTCEDFGNVD